MPCMDCIHFEKHRSRCCHRTYTEANWAKCGYFDEGGRKLAEVYRELYRIYHNRIRRRWIFFLRARPKRRGVDEAPSGTTG